MLPSCARAIETGYSLYTSRSCWGPGLGDPWTKCRDISAITSRGFGIRILPSYARCLEENDQTATAGGAALRTTEPGLKTLKKLEHFAYAQELQRRSTTQSPLLHLLHDHR